MYSSDDIIADSAISKQTIATDMYTVTIVMVAGVGVPTFTGCSGSGEPSPCGPYLFELSQVVGPGAGRIQSLGSLVGT